MGLTQKVNGFLIIFLLTIPLSISSSTQFIAQGRSVSESTRRELVGSTPPRCERRCDSCRRCEAVQVPVENQRSNGHFDFQRSIAYFRDGFSNYKPVGWKCKCGDLFFNP